MQEERFTIRQNNLFAHHAIQRRADFRLRPTQVNKARRVPAESPKLIPQPNIDRRAVNALNGRARINGQTPLIQPGFYISVAQTHERSPLRHCAPTPSGDKGKLASLCTLHNSFVLFKELTDLGLQNIDGDTVLTAARHNNIGILFGRVDKLQEHRAHRFLVLRHHRIH